MRKTTLIIALLASSAAHGQMFKCTDPATGRTIFSQTQCATEAQSIDVDVHRPSDEQRQQARERAAEAERVAEEIRQDRAIQRARQLEAHRSAEQQRQLQVERQTAGADEYRAGRPGKFRSGSGRYDFVMPGPPRVAPPPPPPRPPKSSTAPRDLYAPGREPPPPPRPPR